MRRQVRLSFNLTRPRKISAVLRRIGAMANCGSTTIQRLFLLNGNDAEELGHECTTCYALPALLLRGRCELKGNMLLCIWTGHTAVGYDGADVMQKVSFDLRGLMDADQVYLRHDTTSLVARS
ncbi:hypothetical protein OH77DRAFT_1117882 [Trametes cingulata]|nr:hypothetical protein OH77DRAFT_1117882 [Trametes cingulata]